MKKIALIPATLFFIGLIANIAFGAVGVVTEIKWTNPSGGNWNNPANWSTGTVPGLLNDVVIDLPGSYTITADIDIDALNLSVGTGVTLYSSGRTVNASVINNGIIIFEDTNTINSGGIKNNSGGILRIRGASGNSGQLTVSGGISNQGLIDIATDSTLKFYGGGLTHSGGNYTETGIIDLSNGHLTLDTDLVYADGFPTLKFDNSTINGSGRFIIQRPLTLTETTVNCHLTNESTLNIKSFTIFSAGFDNQGTIDIEDDSTLGLFHGSLTYPSGNWNYIGNGTLELFDVTLTLDTDLLYTDSIPSLKINSATINGPGHFIIQRPLTLSGATVNCDLVNKSTLGITSFTNFTADFDNQGTVSITSGSTLRFNGGGLTYSGGNFTGSGTIDLSGAHLTLDTDLTYTEVMPTLKLNGATINGPGHLTIQRPLVITQGLNNQGTINIASGSQNPVTIAGELYNQGTINIADGSNLNFINNSSLTCSGGNFSGTGTIDLSHAYLTLDTDLAYIDGMPNLKFNSTTINGPGSFTVQKPLTFSEVKVNCDLINKSTLNVRSWTNFFSDGFANQPDAILSIQGSSGQSGNLTLANGFTNQGTIELTNNDNSPDAAGLTVTSGVLINQGMIKSLPGAGGGPRNLNANLDNQENLLVSQDLTLIRTGVSFSNSGSINIDSGKVLDFNVDSITNKENGVITGSGRLDTSGKTLVNKGRISPGLTYGTLSFIGNLSQETGSNTNIKISGTTAGTQYDRISVSSTAKLDGDLNISLADGYIPQIGDTFNIVTSSTRTGTFKKINPVTINGLLDWDVDYTATGAKLKVIEGAGVLRMTMTGNTGSLPLYHELTYTLKVLNAGTETETNVVVTDTLPSSVIFASAALSRGTYTQNEGVITCSLGDLAPLESATITITVVPTFISTISNTATITTDTTGIEDKTIACSTTVTELPGDYDVDDSPIDLAVSGITPDFYGNTVNSLITLSGIGFDNQTTISLIAPDGTEIFPVSADPDSLFQMTVEFDLSGLPVGRYDVKVSDGTQSKILNKAFEVFETQKAQLETHLVLPGKFGRHHVSTIYVEYKNTGNVAMPAPMLILQSADPDDSDKPMITLDPTKVVQNLWTAVMPDGVGHTVSFLADGDGDTPGVLLPGESGRMPVYYTGLLRPWDFSDQKVEFEVRIIDADDPTPYDWDSKKDAMKPESMDNRAWDIIFANLKDGVGETWGDYIFALSEDAAYLNRHFDRKVNSIEKLFRFELAQSMGLCNPLPYLAGGTDMAIAAPGLPLGFSRSFSSSVAARFKDGPMGPGWVHAWQINLEEDQYGNVTIISGNTARSYTLDSRGGYFSSPGDYAKLTRSGDIYTLTYPNGIIQKFTNDGKLDYIEDLNGNRITTEYSGDLLSRLIHSSGQYMAFSYSGGLLTNISDQTGQLSVSFTYDSTTGQLASATDIMGRTTQYEYDTSGTSANALSGIIYPNTTRTGFSYDDHGRLSQIDINGTPESHFTYDSTSKVIVTADADGSENTFFYDAEGHLGKTIDPLGNITTMAFNDQHKLTQVRTPDGHLTQLTHDSKGNTTRVTDPLDQTVSMSYTTYNRLSKLIDAKEQPTSFSYDPQGNNDSMTYPDLSQETYQYDSFGNLTQITNRRGFATGFVYNADGRLTDKTSNDGNVTYTYDDVGNLTSMNDPTGLTTYTYYPNHLLKRVTYPTGLYLEYTYDSLGRRAAMVDQDGREITYTYNPFGQLESVSETGKGQVVHYTYDAKHRLKTKVLGNGVTTSYAYDIAGRLSLLTNTSSEGMILSKFAYTFDEMGRRTAMETNNGKWEYGYDITGRLVSAVFTATNANIPDRNISYTYDAAGNRSEVTSDSGTTAYSVNTLNQYEHAGNTHFDYDADGNLITKTDGNGITTYTYNDDNRLVSMAGPQGLTEYQYDGLGNLTAVTKNGIKTHYLIDPAGYGNVTGEYDDTGALTTGYTHGMGLISKDNHYFTFDGSGNTSELTEDGTTVENTYTYDPFGKVFHSTGTVENDLQFAGQFGIRNAGDDLLFMRNRFYMTHTGRFMNPDPIGLAGGINLYAYVQNDPVNKIDPLGLFVFGVFGGGSGGFGGVIDGSVAVVVDHTGDVALAVDVAGSAGPMATADLSAGVVIAPFAKTSDLAGESKRVNLGFGIFGVSVAIPDNPWKTSVSIDVLPGFDFGITYGAGNTWLFGEDQETPCK